MPALRPLFFILPADIKDYTAATVPLYEYREEGRRATVLFGRRAEPQCALALDAPGCSAASGETRRASGYGDAQCRSWVWSPVPRSRLQEETRWIHPCPSPMTVPAIDCDLAERPSRRPPIGWPIERNRAGSGKSSINWRAIPRSAGMRSRAWRSVERELRLSIIDELSALGPRPGAVRLLRLLSSARDPATRTAARSALERIDGEARRPCQLASSPTATPEDPRNRRSDRGAAHRASGVVAGGFQTTGAAAGALPGHAGGRPGRGSIVVSVNQMEPAPDRRVPVRRAAGHPRRRGRGRARVAGPAVWSMSWTSSPEADCVRDVPELASACSRGA